METGSADIPEYQQTVRTTESGPICIQANQSVPSLLQLADPFAEATDAFFQDWRNMKGFANPPWNLISRVLMRTQTQGADVILVAPVWKAEPWYALLLSMLVDWPHLLPKQSTGAHTESETIPLEPQLAVWSISGTDSAAKAFQAKLQTLSSNHGGQRLTNLTTHCLGDGIAGVLNGFISIFRTCE